MSFLISFSPFSFKTRELNNTRERNVFRTVTEEVAGISESKNMYVENLEIASF
jgi:hypothetical protein